MEKSNEKKQTKNEQEKTLCALNKWMFTIVKPLILTSRLCPMRLFLGKFAKVSKLFTLMRIR